MKATAMFHTLYAVGIVTFVVAPSYSLIWTCKSYAAAGFGLVTCGTYDLSNTETLKPWAWALVASKSSASSAGGLEARDELLDEHSMELNRRSALTELLQAAQRGSAGQVIIAVSQLPITSTSSVFSERRLK